MRFVRFLPLLLLVLIGCATTPIPISVREQGAIGDGYARDTAAFQKAIDLCASAGGGVVDVPPGDYLIGSIELKSNTTLQLAKGANLLGSPNLEDYLVVRSRWEGEWVDAHRGLIYAKDAHHIAILGPGHIAASSMLGGRRCRAGRS